ncbi:variant erythrocyte surface antigen-1 family protein [Babesia divergens]|uniref:Variant erythrocyte surface antigen-1 family protein n=1 Tax=Babesia divergens TaxID=32595 RepID=A0AAD9LG63_BABDI|nr:variant erythrocyte surface antigen-1 family protein [Babesia divergens]
MGFKAEHLPTPGKSGSSLSPVLNLFCGSSSSSLTPLVKFLTCISRAPPETLGEFFVFFKIFVPQLKSKFQNFDPYVSKEPGRPSAKDIKDALETLYGSAKYHWKDPTKNGKSDGEHLDPSKSPATLWSLSECHAPKAFTCGPYLNPLAEDVYDIFIDSPGMYLSWICYLPKDFKTLLEEFKQKFSDCCSSGKCQKIVECPCALPLIYSRGFQFMSPNDLNGGTAKKCSQFLAQLKKVLQSNAPLGLLIKAIEEFLWSIREPFFLFIMAFWAFVISYFLYVQLYKLDLLHLKSHAHLSRSFKILPSTLFSDASSKLKDLSYFTL